MTRKTAALRKVTAGLLGALTLSLVYPVLHTQSSNRAATLAISGVVSSAASGQPLAGSVVTLRDTSTRDFAIVGETLSDDQGRFTFINLPEGRFALSAGHRGYVSAGFEEHDGAFTAIVTGDNLDTTGLALSLAKLGAIFGTVTEDSGDPVPQARLTLFRRIRRQGAERIERAGTFAADEMGNFEFTKEPGNYFLCASGTPWYRPMAGSIQRADDGGAGGQTRSPLDVAYPLACYADTTDPAGTEPIPLRAGEKFPANLTLHPVPAIHVLFQAPKAGLDRGVAMPQLNQQVFGISDPAVSDEMTVPNRNGNDPEAGSTIEFSGIAPGRYALEWPGADLSQPSPLASDLDVSSGDVSVDASSLEPMASVSGKMMVAGGGELGSGVSVMLVTTQGEAKGSTAIEGDGSFHLRGVPPGEYGVIVSGSGLSLAITQIRANGKTAGDGIFKVGSDPVELSVMVAKPSAAVTGFVTRNGKPAGGVFVLLVPSDPNAGPFAWMPNQSDSDGSFVFRFVIPGQYTAVAIEQGWTLDWGRPEVIGPYLARGAGVTVAPNSKKIDLEAPVEAQALGAPQVR